MSCRLVLVLAACASVLLAGEQSAEPCGVKLNIKAPRVKKPYDRSSNPSQILLLGEPPRALSKELTGRGHKVEVASSADEARRVRYHAVIADADQEQEARSRWPGALIVVRKGDTKGDANIVEQRLGASPSRTLVARTPQRTSRDDRAPIRTGPPQRERRGAPVAAGGGSAAVSGDDRAPAASGSGGASATAAAPTPPAAGDTASDADPADRPASPAKPAATGSKRVAAATVDTSASAEAEASDERPAVPARIVRRIFFSNSSAGLSSRARAKLVRNAKWLQRHANRSVVVEGHASTTGPAEPNQVLSQARADAVKDFLVESGVEESRIEVMALGMSKPEFNPGYNAKNRRVVIKVVKP